MRFGLKLFLAIFLSAFGALGLLAFSIERNLRSSLEREYLSRYDSLSQIVGDTLRQMEAASETISTSAVRHLAIIEKKFLPDDQALQKLGKEFGVQLFCVGDRDGKMLRDTVTPPEGRDMGFFDFCPDYKKLVRGQSTGVVTPIIPSNAAGKSFKFSLIPNSNGDRILEAGVEIGFIQEILQSALKSDPNVLSIGLYTPSGFRIGYTASGGVGIDQKTIEDLHKNIGHTKLKDRFVFTRKVAASTEICCECVTKKLTNADGLYYYILRTEVSLAPLINSLHDLRIKLLSFLLVGILLSFFLAQFLSKRLVQKIKDLNAGVQSVMQSNDLSHRVKIQGHDEIADLGKSFDNLISQLQESQVQMLEAERSRSVAQVASQVAHDIRSPLAALNMVIRDIQQIPEERRLLIRAAVDRITNIANDLLARYRSSQEIAAERHAAPLEGVYLLPSLLESLLAEKRAEIKAGSALDFELRIDEEAYGSFARLNKNEFKRLLSNLLNNSIEACGDRKGIILIHLVNRIKKIEVQIQDNGCGITPEKLSQLRKNGGTFDKDQGHGLGLKHARESLTKWGGSLDIESQPNLGCKVTLLLPQAESPDWFVPRISLQNNSTVIVLDDDPSIHEIWRGRLAPFLGKIKLVHCYTAADFIKAQREQTEEEVFSYLVDFELLNEEWTGLDLIEKLRIEKFSTLVTSRYEEADVTRRCSALKIGIIPKGLASLVPIAVIGGK